MQSNEKQSKAMQSKAMPSKTKQCRAKQSNANQSKAKQSKAKQGQSRAKQSKALQSKAKQLHFALPSALPFALRTNPYWGRAGFICVKCSSICVMFFLQCVLFCCCSLGRASGFAHQDVRPADLAGATGSTFIHFLQFPDGEDQFVVDLWGFHCDTRFVVLASGLFDALFSSPF